MTWIEALSSAGALGALLVTIGGVWTQSRYRSAAIHELDEELAQLTRRAREAAQVSLHDFVVASLKEAAARQGILALKSEGRLQTLYGASLGLTVVAVIVPFVQVMLYLRTDPLEQARRLKELGLSGSEIATLAGRDWHLLLVGASFGLLFLAAARGVLFAEGKQREAYFRLQESVAYYGDLTRYLQIAARCETDELPSTGPTRLAVTKIQERLLAGAQRRVDFSRDDQPKDQSPDIAKVIEELTKRAPPGSG